MTLDLATIEMPTEEAEARLAEYREQLQAERTDQDRRIAAGLRALRRGLPLIKLAETVQRGGWFDNGLPKIAVVRAHATVCEVAPDSDDLVFYADGFRPENRGAMINSNSVRIHAPRPASIPWQARKWRGHTTVPSIPPRLRPNKKRLHLFHLLWEVEAWELIPPRDPALLRHIGGDLWAVVATWDLTELERAVLGGR